MINNANAVRIKHELEEGAISEDTFKLLIPEFSQLVSRGLVVENLDVRRDGNKYYCEVMLGGNGAMIMWANLCFTQKQAIAEYSIYDELSDKNMYGKTHFISISRTKSIMEHLQGRDNEITFHSAHFVQKICKDFPVFGDIISKNVVQEPLYQEFRKSRDTRSLRRLIAKCNSEMQ